MVILLRGATHTPCRNGTLICRLGLTGRNKSYLREQQMDWEWVVIPVIKQGDASQDIQFQSYHAIIFFSTKIVIFIIDLIVTSPDDGYDDGESAKKSFKV